MNITRFITHIIFMWLGCCSLLTVLADTTASSSSPSSSYSTSSSTHNKHHQHSHVPHQTHVTRLQQKQHHYQQHKEHLTPQSQHLHKLSSIGGVTLPSATNARQSKVLNLKSQITTEQQKLQQQQHPSSQQKSQISGSSLTAATALAHPNNQIEFIEEIKQTPKNNNNKISTLPINSSTKLRRLSARDFYNRVSQRRFNARRNAPDEWSYNTYNINTNTFGSPTAKHNDRGDDNSDDVEFVSNTGVRTFITDWARRGYVPPLVPSGSTESPVRRPTTTLAPPPALVPAKRGYATQATTTAPSTSTSATTEDPFETNVISKFPGNMEPRDMERRHICVQQRTIKMPFKTTEVYSQPKLKHVSTPCQPQTHTNQLCTRVQIVHEQAYRDVIRYKSSQQVTHDCCTGWMRDTPNAEACMKPICAARCQNGGSCTGPETCSCPAGFTGRYCEQDINECKAEKPCDQNCINTVGSYYCKCREGFRLQEDQQSCKKIDLHEEDAFEARDLENEIETQEDITARLQKLEKQLANERVQTNELQKTLQNTYTMVDTLQGRLVTLEKQQLDINRLQTNLYKTESRTMKLEGMVNLLMKCRNGPNANCP